MGYHEIWMKMLRDNYGVQGRPISERWLNYEKWLKDVTKLPDASVDADLVSINGKYFWPNTVKWVTRKSPSRGRPLGSENTKPTKNQKLRIYDNGKEITQKKTAEVLGIKRGALWQRLYWRHMKNGQTVFDLNDLMWE